MYIYLFVWSTLFLFIQANDCVCTQVECPQVGLNNIIMGNGGANITYEYIEQGGYVVISSAYGTVQTTSLDNGSETTSCTQKYSRMLEDDGEQNCDAGHILANRLGGYGNTPINIFPQDATVNRGIYAQFEGEIYNCLSNGTKIANVEWYFLYENSERTMPNYVNYTATFVEGNCTTISTLFPN